MVMLDFIKHYLGISVVGDVLQVKKEVIIIITFNLKFVKMPLIMKNILMSHLHLRLNYASIYVTNMVFRLIMLFHIVKHVNVDMQVIMEIATIG
jgi:hypothetical protein